ncbi:MAG: TetR/AcrR family transcriptional regulator [Gordonia sp. (in: high G+C Gram-positive bacteria)]
MPAHRASPAAAARAAVVAAANPPPGSGHMPPGADAAAPKPDGRRARWDKHKQARRTELTDATIEAVRALGGDVAMDDIATHIGVSKTVLYRYFTDKSDLGAAAMSRVFETTLLPRLTEALGGGELDDYTLARTVISLYVHAVADDPELYRFALATSPSRSTLRTPAEAEKLVAGLLTMLFVTRLTERGGEIDGAETWSYALVGGIQRTVDRWMEHPDIEVDALIDYLAMLAWSAVVGIAQVNGSREVFTGAPPQLPPVPGEAAP